MACQHVGDGAVGNALLILLFRDFRLETAIEIAAGLGVEHEPHLGLAHLVVHALCHLVVGVNLDAEVSLGIDKLHEQWHLAAILLADGLAEYGLGVGRDDRDEILAFFRAIAYRVGT